MSIELAIQLAVALVVAYLVAFWAALVLWALRDIRSRTANPITWLLAVSLVVVFNVPGVILYLLLRPRETIAESYERALEEESLLQEIEEQGACPKCKGRVEADFLLCPNCRTRLKKVCPQCSRPVHVKWSVCPYCAREFAPIVAPDLTARVP
ncbi:MAG: zinc ribbon domain-containing protein [Dehalococcoidia bacterium]|nr:zinc ribbon domain-containing protein [Dehalococcoidia bacterium]